MKPKVKKFIKWTLILVAVIIAYLRWSSLELEEKVNETIWWIIIVGIFGWFSLKEIHNELQRLESKTQVPKNAGTISSIMEFSFELTKPFFKMLQQKLGLDNEVIGKIQEAIPRVRFNVEFYTNEFTRVKVWYYYRGDKSEYFEYNNRHLRGRDGFEIWRILIDDYLPEEKAREAMVKETGLSKIELIYRDYREDAEILFYLKGGIFGEKNRVFEDSDPLDENILFRISTNNFKELERYHLLNREPDEFYKYRPSPYERTYGYIEKELDKNGFYWYLHWFDWTLEKLPKLKYDQSGNCIGHIL